MQIRIYVITNNKTTSLLRRSNSTESEIFLYFCAISFRRWKIGTLRCLIQKRHQPIPFSQPMTDCSLNLWLFSEPMTVLWTYDCSLNLWLFSPPMTIVTIYDCSLNLQSVPLSMQPRRAARAYTAACEIRWFYQHRRVEGSVENDCSAWLHRQWNRSRFSVFIVYHGRCSTVCKTTRVFDRTFFSHVVISNCLRSLCECLRGWSSAE